MNLLAVVAAAAASFLFGGLYYGWLGDRWLAAVGKAPADVQGTTYMRSLVVTFFAQLVMAWVLAGLIGHLGQGQVTWRNGLISGLFVWAGFVATILVATHAFQSEQRSLTLIDGAHWLGVLALQGLIIGLFGA